MCFECENPDRSGYLQRLRDDLAAHSLHGSPPTQGERVPLRSGPVIEAVRLAEPSVHLVFAVALYGPDIRALQLVHADSQGRFPWSPDYRDGRGGQPVLGVRDGAYLRVLTAGQLLPGPRAGRPRAPAGSPGTRAGRPGARSAPEEGARAGLPIARVGLQAPAAGVPLTRCPAPAGRAPR